MREKRSGGRSTDREEAEACKLNEHMEIYKEEEAWEVAPTIIYRLQNAVSKGTETENMKIVDVMNIVWRMVDSSILIKASKAGHGRNLPVYDPNVIAHALCPRFPFSCPLAICTRCRPHCSERFRGVILETRDAHQRVLEDQHQGVI